MGKRPSTTVSRQAKRLLVPRAGASGRRAGTRAQEQGQGWGRGPYTGDPRESPPPRPHEDQHLGSGFPASRTAREGHVSQEAPSLVLRCCSRNGLRQRHHGTEVTAVLPPFNARKPTALATAPSTEAPGTESRVRRESSARAHGPTISTHHSSPWCDRRPQTPAVPALAPSPLCPRGPLPTTAQAPRGPRASAHSPEATVLQPSSARLSPRLRPTRWQPFPLLTDHRKHKPS